MKQILGISTLALVLVFPRVPYAQSPITLAEVSFFFDQGNITLPAPEADFLVGNGSLEVQAIKKITTCHWTGLTYTIPSQNSFWVSVYTKEGLSTGRHLFHAPASSQPTLSLILDTVLVCQWSEMGQHQTEHLAIDQAGNIYSLSKVSAATLTPPFEMLQLRLLSSSDLSEYSTDEIGYLINLLLAAKQYRLPTKIDRQRVKADLPNYRPRYWRESRVPLTDIEKLNLNILRSYLENGHYPSG